VSFQPSYFNLKSHGAQIWGYVFRCGECLSYQIRAAAGTRYKFVVALVKKKNKKKTWKQSAESLQQNRVF